MIAGLSALRARIGALEQRRAAAAAVGVVSYAYGAPAEEVVAQIVARRDAGAKVVVICPQVMEPDAWEAAGAAWLASRSSPGGGAASTAAAIASATSAPIASPPPPAGGLDSFVRADPSAPAAGGNTPAPIRPASPPPPTGAGAIIIVR